MNEDVFPIENGDFPMSCKNPGHHYGHAACLAQWVETCQSRNQEGHWRGEHGWAVIFRGQQRRIHNFCEGHFIGVLQLASLEISSRFPYIGCVKNSAEKNRPKSFSWMSSTLKSQGGRKFYEPPICKASAHGYHFKDFHDGTQQFLMRSTI